MSEFLINRCICHNRSFAEIKKYAAESGRANIEQLQEKKICSCGCGLCIPYIERMLETGQTEFKPGALYKNKKDA